MPPKSKPRASSVPIAMIAPSFSSQNVTVALRRISARFQTSPIESDPAEFIVTCKLVPTLLRFSPALTAAQQRLLVDTMEIAIITFCIRVLPSLLAQWNSQSDANPPNCSMIVTLFEIVDEHVSAYGDFVLQLRMAALLHVLHDQMNGISIPDVTPPSASKPCIRPTVKVRSMSLQVHEKIPTKARHTTALVARLALQSSLSSPRTVTPQLSLLDSPSPDLPSLIENLSPSPSPPEIQISSLIPSPSPLSFCGPESHYFLPSPSRPSLQQTRRLASPSMGNAFNTPDADSASSPEQAIASSESQLVSSLPLILGDLVPQSVGKDHDLPSGRSRGHPTPDSGLSEDFSTPSCALPNPRPGSNLTINRDAILIADIRTNPGIPFTPPTTYTSGLSLSRSSSPYSSSPNLSDRDPSRRTFSTEALQSLVLVSNLNNLSASLSALQQPVPLPDGKRTRATSGALPAKRKHVEETEPAPMIKRTTKVQSRVCFESSSDSGIGLRTTRIGPDSVMLMDKENQDVM